MADIVLRSNLSRLLTPAEGDSNFKLAASDSYGPDEPTVTWPGKRWADQANGVRKIRNDADDDWITLGPIFDPFGTAAFLDAIGSGPLYGRDSIVGTVSEFEGIPTGALVEYGSNEGGEFWRYAGGMQVCKKYLSEYMAVSGASGSLFIGVLQLTTTGALPAAFATTPSIHVTPVGLGTSNVLWCASLIEQTPSINRWGGWYVLSNGSRAAASILFSMTAIGSWI
ncbi:hypothetical protein RE432_14820 [Pusillimonas sp. SM2304]|uniref:hypothetical protein n=1 Tax=Pusillimonas sp. SM2304 TaxID=3073241 RepID=UPI0028746D69|nr:hypothetical protein [Pusillimonas sp. SM2304]MDS1141712.1 hypothetical protein [Pusillimonas sp. SM2304]